MSEFFPVFLKLSDKPVLVVGAGSVGWAKVRSLQPAGARLTVIAPQACEEIRSEAEAGRLRWEQRAFAEQDAAGQTLIFAATGERGVNRRVVEAAERRGIPANAVDDPELCSFYSAAVLRRGPVQVAIGTSGEFPGLSRAFREQLERLIPPESGEAGAVLSSLRAAVRASDLPAPRRRDALKELVDWFSREYLSPRNEAAR